MAWTPERYAATRRTLGRALARFGHFGGCFVSITRTNGPRMTDAQNSFLMTLAPTLVGYTPIEINLATRGS
jgi:hypothetical protein